MNLLAGLPDNGGAQALENMRDRGARWLSLAQSLDLPSGAHLSDPMLAPAKRPSPKPAIESRPKTLPVTAISKLIRDPYHVYARYIFKLYPLNPLHMSADARLRGEVLHKILERFVKTRPSDELLPQNAAAAKPVFWNWRKSSCKPWCLGPPPERFGMQGLRALRMCF